MHAKMTAVNMDSNSNREQSEPPHFLGLGFDWINGYNDFENHRPTRATAADAQAVYKARLPTFHTTHTAKASRPDFHTTLNFTRPVDHPLSRNNRKLPVLLRRAQPRRQASSFDSSCVSSLGVGGYESDEEMYEPVDDRQTRNQLDQHVESWTVEVDTKTGEAPWFKVLQSGDDQDVVWLEGDEIFVLIDSLKSKTKSITVHMLQDDVVATVSLREAKDLFSAIVVAPPKSERSPTSVQTNTFLKNHLSTLGRRRSHHVRQQTSNLRSGRRSTVSW
jgi:hypothetical protein